MRIRIWNAFASNNSGSYVIVGNFRSEERASEVAAELLDVAKAHSAWRAEHGHEEAVAGAPLSPIDAFARRHGIPLEDGEEDWPQYSKAEHPAVWSIGHQVFVHVDYTVTMPRLLGHYMYVRGGRVVTELNHAHHPIVAVFEIGIPWQQRKGLDIAARVRDIVDRLCAEDGALTLRRAGTHAPAWRGVVAGEPAFGEADLTVGAVFDDLAAGFAGVAAAAKAHGAYVYVTVSEAHGDGDPLAFLRPCVPPTRHALVDVVLEEIGLAPTNVVKVVADVRGLRYPDAHAYVATLPATIAAGVTLAQAEALRARLAVGNAVVSLRVSPSAIPPA